MNPPIIHAGVGEAWAPASAVFWRDRLFFTGLRGESLYEAKITPAGTIEHIKTHFRWTFGRLRALKIGPDGFLYISTSNTDGRGNPRLGDDKVIRVNLNTLISD